MGITVALCGPERSGKSGVDGVKKKYPPAARRTTKITFITGDFLIAIVLISEVDFVEAMNGNAIVGRPALPFCMQSFGQ